LKDLVTSGETTMKMDPEMMRIMSELANTGKTHIQLAPGVETGYPMEGGTITVKMNKPETKTPTE
jgi:hypothetical protein